jgi:predicted Fe-S protein YdhL (DUF1289 family)
MISSPCVKICVMDTKAGTCAGCGRTLDEIARWGAMGENERLRIMETLQVRLEKLKAQAGA